MVVILHVVIALASLLAVTYSLFRPSIKSIIVNYMSIATTIVSGLALVIIEPVRMLHTCIAGLSYLVLAITVSVIAQARLARTRNNVSTS